MFSTRRLVIAAGAAALAAGAAGATAAQAAGTHTVTITQTSHGSFLDDQAFNPCTGDAVTVEGTGTQVNHVTYFTGSDEVWGTFTETGTVSFTDQGVDYSGRATVWGNFNLNRTNGNQSFTLSIRVSGSDGSVVIAHLVTHTMFDAEGNPVTSWEKAPLLTCG
jgi:hypothetical protein